MSEAKVICDSINVDGDRLTTFVLKYPRFIHSELMTHRMFSRNAASSRAIPVRKMIDQVLTDPAMPVFWGANKPGMQASEELDEDSKYTARAVWLEARDAAVLRVAQLVDLGLHKQIANRILEPWMWMTSIVTATEWTNFYSLRTDAAAQPEFRDLALKMLDAHNASEPKLLKEGGWHLPFILPEEKLEYGYQDLVKFSVARVARVSYLNHDGTAPDPKKDLELYDRLVSSGHMSPTEHIAIPAPYERWKNFIGWRQHRAMIDGENRKNFEGLKQK